MSSLLFRGKAPLIATRSWPSSSVRAISILTSSKRSTGIPPIMSTLTRRVASSKPPPPSHSQSQPQPHSHDSHDHDHSHSIFSTHTHDHSEGAEQLISALASGRRLDRGMRITLLGLASNVGLTLSKGLAGLWMNSASLLAEAGHSLSDLLGPLNLVKSAEGDFVTLATWRISRKSPSDMFPWGYSKFETFGTLSVSVILIGGAIGISLHSYHLLLQTLLPFIDSLPPSSSLHTVAQYLPQGVPSPLLEMFHSHGPSALPHEHGHSHGDAAGALADAHGHGPTALLNPHAAWFALASVIIKEWLYRVTNRVAVAEHSPVLKANALHHRADALTSGVALGSILGSSFGGWTFLDPVGGLAVSLVILQQGLSLSKVALYELLDAGMDAGTKKKIEGIVREAVDGIELIGFRDVRGVKSGGQLHLDLTLDVHESMTVRDSHAVEQRVRDLIKSQFKQAKEIKIHIHGEEPGETGTKGGCL